jgi:hypothetical protein
VLRKWIKQVFVNDVEIVSIVVCDDVRREENGKEILIGVYGSDIILDRFPGLVAPVFWVQMIPNDAEKLSIGFRLINEADAVFFTMTGTMEAKRPFEKPGRLG